MQKKKGEKETLKPTQQKNVKKNSSGLAEVSIADSLHARLFLLSSLASCPKHNYTHIFTSTNTKKLCLHLICLNYVLAANLLAGSNYRLSPTRAAGAKKKRLLPRKLIFFLNSSFRDGAQ